MSDYTIMRADEAPDYTGNAPGAFLGYGRPLGCEQVALNVRVLAPHETHRPPGVDPDWGHSHKTIEEIYFVLEGELRVKLGDAVETLRRYDAVRIPPGTPRSVRNETDEEARFAMVSVRTEDPRAESVQHEGFWPVG
ncbi:MAG TPA: cupin domain-containing protein [Gaiellaceae bacterium]|nr:cupin domain-containing protein [Gaiellaceae bacterium]